MADGDRECPFCEAPLVDVLELPGGRVVREDAVPFGAAVRGVTAHQGCPDCGVSVDE